MIIPVFLNGNSEEEIELKLVDIDSEKRIFQCKDDTNQSYTFNCNTIDFFKTKIEEKQEYLYGGATKTSEVKSVIFYSNDIKFEINNLTNYEFDFFNQFNKENKIYKNPKSQTVSQKQTLSQKKDYKQIIIPIILIILIITVGFIYYNDYQNQIIEIQQSTEKDTFRNLKISYIESSKNLTLTLTIITVLIMLYGFFKRLGK